MAQDNQQDKESVQVQKLEAELSSARAADDLKQQLLDDLQTKLASQDGQVEVLAKVSETGKWPQILRFSLCFYLSVSLTHTHTLISSLHYTCGYDEI